MRSYVVLTALVLSSSVAVASPITYSVNQSVGSTTAMGTVTTDGTLGVLGSTNIVGFTFTVANGGGSDTFSKGFTNSAGSNLTATSTGLFFNYSGPSGGILLGDSTLSNFVCFTAPSVTCNGNTGLTIEVAGVASSSGTLTGLQQIGSTSATVTTPEPSSLAFLGTGALGVFGVLRRRVLAR